MGAGEDGSRLLCWTEHDRTDGPEPVQAGRDPRLHSSDGGHHLDPGLEELPVCERGETKSTPDLRVVDPAFEVLPGNGVPERGALILASTENAYRLARSLRINPLVILRSPFTSKAEKLN
jgi:hypothetical protein